MATNLNALMDDAQARAQNFQPPAAVANGHTSVAVAGHKPTLNDFLDNAGMVVAHFLQVRTEGLRFEQDWKGLIDDFEAEIDMTEITPLYSATAANGSNYRFIKSYDGAVSSDGEPWPLAVQKLVEFSDKGQAKPYPTAEIPMTLTKEVKEPKGGTRAYPVGTRIGLTPSMTGFKAFQQFALGLRAAGQANDVIRVKVKHAKRVKPGNEWGVAEFELLEVVESRAAGNA